MLKLTSLHPTKINDVHYQTICNLDDYVLSVTLLNKYYNYQRYERVHRFNYSDS